MSAFLDIVTIAGCVLAIILWIVALLAGFAWGADKALNADRRADVVAGVGIMVGTVWILVVLAILFGPDVIGGIS